MCSKTNREEEAEMITLKDEEAEVAARSNGSGEKAW